MKNIKLKLILVCSVIGVCSIIILNNCNKKTGDTTTSASGVLQNPSFEAGNGINADSWGGTVICPGGCCAQCTRTAMTGPGFMPTSGTYYMSMQYASTYCSTNPFFYQDNVNLSKAHKMIFDYEFTGTSSSCSGFKFFVLFTANGNDTLLYRTFTSAAVQVRNDTITLPSLPTPGRLLFTITGPWGIYCQPTLNIDNIRFL